MSVQVLLADDHKIVREGLRSILENELKMSVVGQAENGRDAVTLAKQLQPDIVIIDISMPDLNGIEATRQILADNPEGKIIALSMHSDKRYVIQMLEAGASGYLLKHCAVDELQQAIQAVMAQKLYVSPDVTGPVIQDYLEQLSRARSVVEPALTPKEREVLQLLAEGKSTKEIASILFVGVPTIETHRQHIMDKLKLFTVAELTKYAIRHGLTSLE